MADTDQQVPEGTEAPKEPSLSEMLANLQKSIEESNDKRFSGFQSLLDKKTAEMESQLEELRLSRMSPADRAEFEEKQSQAELARIKRENEILRRYKDHPEEVAFLQKFLEQDNLDAQLALLATLKGQPAPATPKEDDEGDEPEPGVNLNNPSRKKEPNLGELLTSGKMTKEAAQKLLTQYNERGSLVRTRG